MRTHRYFVSGIGTDVGKTVISAIFAEALEAHYWKPVQAGDLDCSDSKKIAQWCSEKVTVLPERFRLNTPASPHWSATLDGIRIEREELQLPDVPGNLIVEGAGGLMVPLDDDGLLYLDLIREWKLPVILVCRNYLGSINHTLLSLEALKQAEIPLFAIVFSGQSYEPSESIIVKHSWVKRTMWIPQAETLDSHFIQAQAERLKRQFEREEYFRKENLNDHE